MAQRIMTSFVDDIDGTTEAVETVKFGIDGHEFEIDLNADNVVAFREAMMVYIDNGRVTKTAPKARKPRVRVRRKAPAVKVEQHVEAQQDASAATVRQWAQEQGITVASRGALPQAVRAQFLEAK